MDNENQKYKYTTDYKSELYYVGKRIKSIQGEEIEILGKSKSNNKSEGVAYICKFTDSGYINKIYIYALKHGKFISPMCKNAYGVGYQGIGKYKFSYKDSNGIRVKSKEYVHWRNMMTRAYNDNYKEKRQTYKDCVVCEEWHNFQNFAEWYHKNKINTDIRIDLDKDLLFEGNKIYSPQTCILIPSKINIFINRDSEEKNINDLINKFNKKGKVSVWITDFDDSKYDIPIARGVSDINLAIELYKNARKQQVENARNYMRKFGYNEEIVMKIR